MAVLLGALLRVGVPYSEAKAMPVQLALALLNGLDNGRQKNSHSTSNGKRKVATRRKSKENE